MAARLSVGEFLGEAEFAAGALIEVDGRILATLNEDWLPAGVGGYRLGGVGGWHEPGETPWETARREVREETGRELELVHAERTWLWDGGAGELVEVACAEQPAPLFVSCAASSLRPDAVYYGVLFLGALDGDPEPADDVAALLAIPPPSWPTAETTVGRLVAEGVEVIGEVDPGARVWVHPQETMPLVLRLRAQTAGDPRRARSTSSGSGTSTPSR